jgi:hypothetical protein
VKPTAVRLAAALTAVQCLSALTWIVYASLLAGLLDAAGVDPGWRPWILLADQGIFALCDTLAGVWLDGAAAATRRLGGALLGATCVSTVTFLALPWLTDAPGAMLACIAVWAVASSALRAPLPRLLGRYASLPDHPGLAGFFALGTGLAGLFAPGAMRVLAREGSRAAFALTSLTLWLLVAMLFVTERSQGEGRTEASRAVEAPSRALPLVIGATFLATLGAQVYATFAASAALRRVAGAAEATGLAVVFPLGMALAAVGGAATKRFGAERSGAAACGMAAVGAAVTGAADGKAAVVGAVLAAGVGWATALSATLTAVSALAPNERAARWTGVWFAAQAAATGVRMGAGMAAGHVTEGAAGGAAVLAWAAAAVMLAASGARR